MAVPDMPDAPDAAPFYSNLVVDPCTGCNYNTDNGFLLLGPNNCGIPGSTQWLAAPFIAAHNGPVKRITLAITDWGICTPTSFGFTVQIYDDACAGVPNNPLGNPANATAPAAPCSTALANFGHGGAVLTAGQKYWVVVTTSPRRAKTGQTQYGGRRILPSRPPTSTMGTAGNLALSVVRVVSWCSNQRHKSNIESSSRRYSARAHSL